MKAIRANLAGVLAALLLGVAMPAVRLAHAAADAADAADAVVARQVAEAFVRRYSELENGADPALADLYDDAARMAQIETQPDGTTRESEMPPKSRKRIVAFMMQTAKIQPYSASYVIDGVERDGQRIRIRTQRHTEPGKYNSRVTMVIAKSAEGEWQIVERIVEFQSPQRAAR